VRGLIDGASYPFRAAALIARTPSLWPYLIVPVLVNVAVGVLIYAGLLAAGFRGIDRLMAGLPPELGVFEPLLQAVLIVVLLLVTGFVFVRFGVILGAPWYDALSARVEQTRTGALPDSGRGGLLGAIQDVFRQVGHESQKLGFVFGLGSLLLLLNLIPAAGTLLSTAGGIVLGATVACLDFLDLPLSRRRLSFGEKLRAVRRGLPASAGFGLVALTLVSVPFVNLISVPICVVAGTLFYVDRVRSRMDERDSPAAQAAAQAATRASRTPTS
jgi:CysZ protein